MMKSFQKFFRATVTAIAVLIFCSGCSSMAMMENSPWVAVDLGTDVHCSRCEFY